jgi:hypothetical protein
LDVVVTKTAVHEDLTEKREKMSNLNKSKR